MSSVATWWTRICAVVTAATLAVFVPAAAWAATTGVDEIAYEAVRRRSRGSSIFGVLGLLCCLGVVAAVVIAVLLIKRGRRPKG